ncbi:MAG: hypothetical protein KGL46_02030 [Hyphomicrobiales bacterium]|nr:hypothetical protein [Hyphomicrobiales bacterium]
MSVFSIRPAAVLTLLLAAASPALGRPFTTPAEQRDMSFEGVRTPCADPGALTRIISKFNERAPDYVAPGVQMDLIESMRETGYRTRGRDLVPRRYCTARALFNDGRRREVVYVLGDSMGWLGVLSDSVEWCVVGLDASHVYGGHCRALRP